MRSAEGQGFIIPELLDSGNSQTRKKAQEGPSDIVSFLRCGHKSTVSITGGFMRAVLWAVACGRNQCKTNTNQTRHTGGIE